MTATTDGGGGTVAAPTDHQPAFTDLDGDFIVRGFSEQTLPNGTEPNALLARGTGGFGLVAEDGIDDLIIGGVKVIEDGVFKPTAITTGFGSTLDIFSYDTSTQRIGWRYTLNRAQDHAGVGGPEPHILTDTVLVQLFDRDGDHATAQFRMNVTDDKPKLAADTDTAQAGGAAATGNVLTDAAPGDAGDSDTGADLMGADGGRLHMADVGSATMGGQLFDANGQLVIQGAQGTLTIHTSGDYSYVARGDATAGAVDSFRYWVSDGDASSHDSLQTLDITIAGGGSSGDGQVINSPGPGSTLTGGAGNDTINASQGPDVLTGGAGADRFAWAKEPWAPARVTDFAVGTDRIDLSALFAAAGYTGSDPVGDKYISLVAVEGGTGILFDHDGAGPSPQWPNYIIKLENIPSASVTWNQISKGQGQAQFGLSPGSISKDEGNSNYTTFSFDVVRTGPAGDPAHVQWDTTGNGAHPATADDFIGAVMPRGSVDFAAGETSKTINISVVADTTNEFDEQFILSIVGVQGGVLGHNTNASGTIVNDDGSTAGDGGVVINSPGYGATLTGGAGNDTLNAGQGPDTLRGAGGADAFVYANLPWNAGHAVDFTVGTDRLDLSNLLRASGYTGSNPIADGYVTLDIVGGVSTRVFYDTDGRASGNTIQFVITTLDNVSPNGLTWAKLTGGAQPPPPPPPGDDGRIINSSREGDTLAGGSGNDTLNAGQGPDRLTGGGGADHFVYAKVPWNAGHATDFTPGTDILDLRGIFAGAGYTGSDPIADRWLTFASDGGGTKVLIDTDGPGGTNPYQFIIVTLDGVPPSQIHPGDWLFH